MGIVLSHTIAASLYYFRNGRAHLRNELTPPERNGQHPRSVQNPNKLDPFDKDEDSSDSSLRDVQLEAINSINEALMPVLDATSLGELREAIKQTISRCVLNTSLIKVFLRDPLTTQLVDENCRVLPNSGFISDILQQRGKTVVTVNHNQDSIRELLGSQHINDNNHSVLLLPIPERGTQKSIGLVVLVSQAGSLSSVDPKKVELCLKQISVIYEVIKNNISKDSGPHISNLLSLIQLCGELNDQDAAKLEIKVVRYLQQQTEAESGFLLLVVPETQMLFCQAVGDSVLQEEVRFAGASSCFAQALETKQPMTLDDIPEDRRQEVEKIIRRQVHSLLCVPVCVKDSKDLLALACVVNKYNGERFSGEDVDIIRQCFKYTATVLTSTLAFQNERKLKNQTQALLLVARKLFTRLDDLTKLLREIMQEARNLTDAERCSVFLLDKDSDELVAMVFDGITADDKEVHITDSGDSGPRWKVRSGQGKPPESNVQGEIRLPKTQGIAGHVATTGTLLNIRDAYSHPLFYRGIDDSTGFRTRNILCFPIMDEEGVVLGVAQLCNKKTFQYFTTFDEDIASAFAVYCCISISHSLMYKKVIDIQYRNSLANELMMFHMQQVPTYEVLAMAESTVPTVTTFNVNFDSFDFAPRTIPESGTILSCLSMFEDLGFSSRWRIKTETLVRFLMMVKKGYRNPPYHNWMHAYAVTHFCYLLIKNLQLHNYLEDIELLALFVSCLCHDIDHRGTTNSFQVQSQSVLAALYSSEGSVMERHHLAQSMCILNTEGSNLFENLSSKEYQTVLDLMRDIILATDLAHHLRSVKEQEDLADSGNYNKASIPNRQSLLCLLMTACDLSDQTKNWHNTKHIASLVYQEFFSQGDLEKALGKNPLEMMDRERACIPELQISFLDNIAAPVYKILVKFFPEAEVVARNVEENRKHWVHIGQLLKLRHGNSTQAMSVEQIISIEDEEETTTTTTPQAEENNQVNGR
ncbi:cGMP-dependent 3',5'-cyclic phosphodiesterase [Aplysia californica]|uniref:Phosphodiesterase n=1 Tax=Aplysia californica TaxID=6500 RepID=A0ABM1W2X2_APLCA|nr:cGMP-dependent 3',5'-cyclic phosphodiesterase [Aplysia californica]